MAFVFPIRLVVLDSDGVLTDGEAQPCDLSLLAELMQLNAAARRNPALPVITIASGRPAPYVDAMMQAIGGHMPAVFEAGAGLYVPDEYRFLPHPRLHDVAAMQQIKQRLQQTLIPQGLLHIQPGKEYSLSLFPADPAQLEALLPAVRQALGPLADAVAWVYAASCLNAMPLGIDKAAGLRFLADVTGVPVTQMLAVGDSAIDLPMLQVAGYRAAPANASAAVQQVVDYVAAAPTTAGLRQILAHYGINKKSLQVS
ncbi:MAG: HAD family hydrolase [Caldilineales bacterium]